MQKKLMQKINDQVDAYFLRSSGGTGCVGKNAKQEMSVCQSLRPAFHTGRRHA